MYSHKQRKLYRSRNGIIFGVCQGIADWRELPVGMVRLVAAIIILATGAFPGLFVYLMMALFLPVEPREDGYHRDGGQDNSNGPQAYRDRKADTEQDWDKRFYDRRK